MRVGDVWTYAREEEEVRVERPKSHTLTLQLKVSASLAHKRTHADNHAQTSTRTHAPVVRREQYVSGLEVSVQYALLTVVARHQAAGDLTQHLQQG